MIARLGGPVAAQAVLQIAQAGLFGAISLALPTDRAAGLGVAVGMITLAVFLCELGYPALLIRAVSNSEAWHPLWCRALRRRFLASLLAALALLLLPVVDATLILAQPLLATAIIPLLMSVISPLPLALGLGANGLVILALLTRALVVFGAAAAVVYYPAGDWWIVAIGMGGGWIAQTLALVPIWPQLPKIADTAGANRDLDREATSILVIASLAAVQDRARFMMLSLADAQELVVRLLLPLALLGGIATLVAQLDRLLFAASIRGESSERLSAARTLIAVCSQALAALVALVLLLVGPPMGWAERAMVLVALAEWSLSNTQLEFYSRRLATRTITSVARPTMIVISLSLGLQLAAAWGGSILMIAATRLLTSLAVGWVCQRDQWRPVWPMILVAALAAPSEEITLVACAVILVWAVLRVIPCLRRLTVLR